MTAPTPSPDQYKTESNTKCINKYSKHPYESMRSSIVARGSKIPEALTYCGTLGAPLPGAPLPGAPLPGAPLSFPRNFHRDAQRTSTLSPAVPLFYPHLSIHQHGPGPDNCCDDGCDETVAVMTAAMMAVMRRWL